MTMNATTVRVYQFARCPCGAPLKAFDFHVEPPGIIHVCRRCHTQLIAIELESEEAEETVE